jgi:hypothetical protein
MKLLCRISQYVPNSLDNVIMLVLCADGETGQPRQPASPYAGLLMRSAMPGCIWSCLEKVWRCGFI